MAPPFLVRSSAPVAGLLAVLFLALFTWSAIEPRSRAVWVAEALPLLLVFGALVWLHGRFRFSNAALLLMSVWLYWHTIGAHYTFAEVPFDWFNDLIGSERNQFDRIGHFSVGFYAFAIAEWLTRRRWCGIRLALPFALFAIMSVAAGYEIVEWGYAVIEGGAAGAAFLGSQGDAWDAQKDMLADTLGALFALALFLWLRPDRAGDLAGN